MLSTSAPVKTIGMAPPKGHDMSHLSLTNIGSPDWSDANPFA